ncbi:MAG: leucyl aminopeptidase [Gammaproteobacteria bacterium]|jgi:leucyl aminopeptidase
MINFEFTLRQKNRAPKQKEVDEQKDWVVLFPSTIRATGKFPYHDHLERRIKDIDDKSDIEIQTMDLPNEPGTRVVFACIKPDITSFELLTLGRKLVKAHKPGKEATLSLHVTGYTDKQNLRIAEALVAATAAASAIMPNYKTSKTSNNRYIQINIYGVLSSDGYKRTLAEAHGNALCRYLSMLPPNILTPSDYLKKLQLLSKAYKWKLDFYDVAALKRKKAGAFLAVSQGSSVQDAGIVCLRYNPTRVSRMDKLALVGKGICYDTGGVNLKPARYMFGMHEDMQGSAVALGVFLALTKLKVDYPVECWLALATNHIGPKAYKPNDIITAADGTTIEIVHTDAEGRMVLADTLVFASEKKPSLIIDYATLTGACVYSIGSSYSGVFSNREKFTPELIRSGQESGERVWPFPMDEDYETSLKSDVADIKQCALEGNADHILAARFLSRFVKHDIPWIHMDLSSSKNKGGLAHIPTDSTGFGIRYTLELLFNGKIWKS